MKITFEGVYFSDILSQMKNILDGLSEKPTTTAIPSTPPVAEAQGPGPEAPSDEFLGGKLPVEIPADIPVEKPKKPRTAKQLENDERLREKALARIAAGGGFQKKAAKTEPVEKKPKPAPQPDMFEEPPKKALDPADIVAVRTKTISALQEAYANGKQQEVFELLSRFGNGAKSFRELPPDAFVPINEAIELGALT